MQLAPHQPSDHEEQLFATGPIDPGQLRVQSNPVLCSLTSGSARVSPKGESFCKGIPNGAAREGAFVADCVPRRRGTQSSPSILACQTLECLLRR